MALEDAATSIDEAFTREGHKGQAFEATYAGALSFLRRTYTKDLTDADVAVTGIPFDCAVTNRPGTRFGPRAVREASALQSPEASYGGDVNPMTEFNVVDYGDVAFDHAKIWEFPKALQDHIAGILATDTACLAIGGDHYVSYPILKAHAEKYGPLSLLHFDAHSDTWVDDDPDRIDHGTMFYKAVKEGLIDVERSVQVGIRCTNDDNLGVPTIDAAEVHRIGPEAVVDKIKSILKDHQTYLTFDIDCLDPAFAPGTGTPVWGGLSSGQAAAILRGLAGINIVGMDVVEVSPQYDVSGATAIAGAHVGVELLCLWAHRQKFGG